MHRSVGFLYRIGTGELLFKHIAAQDLFLDGKSLNDAIGPQAALEMREFFEEDQRQQITTYRRAKRIPEHPGLQRLYYLMAIYSCGGITDPYTPCYCFALQTLLGCCTT